MKLTAREKELREQYSNIYKNLKINFPKNKETYVDEVTHYLYAPNYSPDRKLIKHLRTITQLIDLYRTDFPSDWKNYISYHFREDKKDEGRKLLFFKKDLSGFELLIKSWWGRKIHIDIDYKKLEQIDYLISFNEHMKKVVLNILHIKKEKNGWDGVPVSCIETILKEKILEEKDLDLYFNQLVEKYNVDLNDSNFVPEKNLDFIASYGKNN